MHFNKHSNTIKQIFFNIKISCTPSTQWCKLSLWVKKIDPGTWRNLHTYTHTKKNPIYLNAIIFHSASRITTFQHFEFSMQNLFGMPNFILKSIKYISGNQPNFKQILFSSFSFNHTNTGWQLCPSVHWYITTHFSCPQQWYLKGYHNVLKMLRNT